MSEAGLAHEGQDRTPAPGVLRTSFPSVAALLLALLVCVVAPTSLIAVHVHENPRLSPIDEAAQFDYVSRMAHGSVPRLGQYLLPSTLRLISCLGNDYVPTGAPPCPGSSHPRAYGSGAYQYEAQQPPTYYAATMPIRWFGEHVFKMGSLTAARMAGALWVSLGLLMLWMAGRLLGLSVRRLVPAMLLLATAPSVVYQAAIVSNDAPGIFAGSLVILLGALAWVRPGRWTAPALFVAGAFVASIKLDDALSVLVVSGVLAIACHRRHKSEGKAFGWMGGWAASGGALVVGAALTALTWVVVSRQLNLIDPRTLPSFGILRGSPINVWLIAHEALGMLNPLAGSYSPFRTNGMGLGKGPVYSLQLQYVTATIAQYLFLGGGLALFFVRPRRWPHWLGLLSLGALYLGGIVLGVGLWRTYNTDPSLSGRYGLSIAPLLAIALVAAIRGKWLIRALTAFSVALTGLTFVYILAA